MAPAPGRMEIVRDLADDRIDDGIDDQRDTQRQADDVGRHAQHLVVEDHREGRQTGLLDAVADGAGGVEELCRQPQRRPAGAYRMLGHVLLPWNSPAVLRPGRLPSPAEGLWSGLILLWPSR